MTVPATAPSSIRHLFGIPLAALRLPQVLELVDEAIATRRPLRIGVVNAAKVVNMQRDPLLRQDVSSSEIVLADGMAVVWASRLLGASLPERVAGIDLMHAMLALASTRGYRVYCLGATDDVLARVVERIRADYPGVVVAGCRNGYYAADDEASVAADIWASRADILLVAMTSPKKEHFMARWFGDLQVPVCHGVGGSFDVMAGKVQRAPALWQRLGLEWLYRVKQEPRRLWRRYLETNTLFILLVLRSWLTRARTGDAAHPPVARAMGPRQ